VNSAQISLEVARRRSAELRAELIAVSSANHIPHLGSSLSCMDLLVALFARVLNYDPAQPDAPDRDRFILSKGHAASALYSVLAAHGFFDPERVFTQGQPGSPLEEHPYRACVPGVEVSSGSLGHGLSLGLGMALAGRLQRRDFRVFCLLSDGECNEGSVWEAAMFAGAQKLDQVCVLVDFNKWQATGRSQDVLALAPLADKWRACGWDAVEIDGHDFNEILPALESVPRTAQRPTAVIAHTVKGKGVSFMEDDNNWHYRIPTGDEVAAARKELGLA
jgi:transketolase